MELVGRTVAVGMITHLEEGLLPDKEAIYEAGFTRTVLLRRGRP
jgi:hypothetical protein